MTMRAQKLPKSEGIENEEKNRYDEILKNIPTVLKKTKKSNHKVFLVLEDILLVTMLGLFGLTC